MHAAAQRARHIQIGQSAGATIQLAGDPGDHPLVTGVRALELADHPHGSLLQLRRVPLRRRVLVHDSILASKVWSLQDSQAGSM